MHKQAHPGKLHEYTYTLILPDNFLTFCSIFISVTGIKCPRQNTALGIKGYKARLESIIAVTASGT